MAKVKTIELSELTSPVIETESNGENWVKVKVSRSHFSSVTLYQDKKVVMDTCIAADKKLKDFAGKDIPDGDHLFRVQRPNKPLFDYLSEPVKKYGGAGKHHW